jgi:Bardet-Biedl syndrome 1 protein
MQGADMHRAFQRELCKLRLATARSYVKVITGGGTGSMLSSAGSMSLRLNARVQGLGPLFKVKIELRNTSAGVVTDVPVTFAYDQQMYDVRCTHLSRIPMLVPKLAYTYDVDVVCLDADGAAGTIKVFVCSKTSCIPVISAVINMPPCEIIDD